MPLILVAVDGHPHSKRIVDFAIGVAKAMSAKILLSFVITESAPEGYHGDDFNKDEFDREVGPLADRIRRAEVECEELWGAGDPKKLIVKTAESRRADMIVVGMHPLHSLGKIRALGDTSRAIIENSKVPVLVIP
jgi:nucleotide-binding universal stress UspA family protein